MARFTSTLDHVSVAAPCEVEWDSMFGNERIRFCGQCKLNVYNLSQMTKGEAEQLIASSEGRLCIRYYRRSDGSILTRNCPVGLRAIKKRITRIASAVTSALVTFFAGLGIYGVVERRPFSAYETGVMVIEHDQAESLPTVIKPVSVVDYPRPEVMGRLVMMKPKGKRR